MTTLASFKKSLKYKILRARVSIGCKGIRHQIREKKMVQEMHDEGLGA